MTKKNFDAITSKNDIARMIGNLPQSTRLLLPIGAILHALDTIELFTGEGNQPSARDSFANSNY